MLKKLVGGVLTDVSLGLFMLLVARVLCTAFDVPMPTGLEAWLGIPLAAAASLIPDYDLVPYWFIRKGKTNQLGLLAIVALAPCALLTGMTVKFFFLTLGVAAFLGIMLGFVVEKRVVERASHWPLWHHPFPVLAICAGLGWLFAHDFSPACKTYYVALFTLPVAAHFLHDGIQNQGFPYLSPLTDTHYRWMGLLFSRVPAQTVKHHYRRQYLKSQKQTGGEDLARRGAAISFDAVYVLVIGLVLAAAAVYYLPNQ